MNGTDRNFYVYQRQRFSILLGWGAANVVLGLLIALVRKAKFWRNFGTMSLGWGAVNAIIAQFGRSSSLKVWGKNGEDKVIQLREAGKMRRLLLVNVPLDALYVVTGFWLRRHKSETRRAWGASIVLQGLWLFFYDGLLALEVGRIWKQK